jgi:hypothetical protein
MPMPWILAESILSEGRLWVAAGFFVAGPLFPW